MAMPPTRTAISDLLDEIGVPYQAHEHAPIYTVEEGRKIAAGLSSMCCKSLLLREKDHFYLLVMESNKRLDAKKMKKALGCKHLSFATPEEIEEHLGSFPGAVSLLCLLFDIDKKVKLVIDNEVLGADSIDCHPATNDCSLKLDTKDVIEKILPAFGREFVGIDI